MFPPAFPYHELIIAVPFPNPLSLPLPPWCPGLVRNRHTVPNFKLCTCQLAGQSAKACWPGGTCQMPFSLLITNHHGRKWWLRCLTLLQVWLKWVFQVWSGEREAGDDGERLRRFLCVMTVHDNDDRFICIFWGGTQMLSEDQVPPYPYRL